MPDSTDDLNGAEEEYVGGIPVRSEMPGFLPRSLVECPSCGKMNSPQRFKCLYCGSELEAGEIAPEEQKLSGTPAEDWEPAFNVVLLNGGNSAGEDVLLRAANSVMIEPETMLLAAGVSTPVPLIRLSSFNEAEETASRIRKNGLDAAVISDADLKAPGTVRRLRSILPDGRSLRLVDFNSGQTVEKGCDELKLMVAGTLFEESAEADVKKKLKETRSLEERSTFSDRGVLDLYFNAGDPGYRILTTGFDFSFLGEAKTMIAAKNLDAVISMLNRQCPNAVFSNDHATNRKLLDGVWPLTRRNTSKGIRRSTLSYYFSKSESLTNIEQFDRYSRLLRTVLCRDQAEEAN